MRTRRLSALILVIGLVVVGLLVDQSDRDDRVQRASDEASTSLEAGVAMPTAAASTALGSTWYCAGGPGEGGHRVFVANPTGREVTGTITIFPGALQSRPGGVAEDVGPDSVSSTSSTSSTSTTAPPKLPEPKAETFTIGPHRRVSFLTTDIVEAPMVAALVEVRGGSVAVEHQVVGEHGIDTAPCASSPASEWHFAWGVTRRDAQELLAFFNPFPDAAAIDVTFVTDEGPREPVRFQGFVVPGRSVVVVDVGEDVTYREQVSTTVRVRRGRIVVDRIQTQDGRLGSEGLTLTLGTTSAAETWVYPNGEIDDGLTERFVVYNPGDAPAEAEIEVSLTNPEKNGTPEPFELTVPARSYKIITLNDDDRIPEGVDHSSIVRSLNGVPVIAERVIFARDPAPRHGISAIPGSPFGATTWVLAAGSASDEIDEWVTIVNVSDEEATLSVSALANGQKLPVAELQDLTVAPNGRRTIQVGEHIERDDLALLVEADQPIVVERSLYLVDELGFTASIGIPLPDGIVIPRPF